MSFFVSHFDGMHPNISLSDRIDATDGHNNAIQLQTEHNSTTVPPSVSLASDLAVADSSTLNAIMAFEQSSSTPVVSTSPVSSAIHTQTGISHGKPIVFASDITGPNWSTQNRSKGLCSHPKNGNDRKIRQVQNTMNNHGAVLSVPGVPLSSKQLSSSASMMTSRTPLPTVQSSQLDMNHVQQANLDILGEQFSSSLPMWQGDSTLAVPPVNTVPSVGHVNSGAQPVIDRAPLMGNSHLVSNLDVGLVASGPLGMNSVVPEIANMLQSTMGPMANDLVLSKSQALQNGLSKAQELPIDTNMNVGSGSNTAVTAANLSIVPEKGNNVSHTGQILGDNAAGFNNLKNADRLVSVEEHGVSAVEQAKRDAENFTMSQLSHKRKKDYLANRRDDSKKLKMSSKSSGTDDEEGKLMNGNLPEHISHRKYQKRLQKNRDSAFVSRIRRREYTRLLEQSLMQMEKEKDYAIQGFREMKRRFEMVTAELNEMKDAAVSNLNSLKESLIKNEENEDEKSKRSQQQQRTSAAITTMFMFALIFGVFLPDMMYHNRAHSTNWGFDDHMGSGSNVRFPFAEFKSSMIPRDGIIGKVWKFNERKDSDSLESNDVSDTNDLKNWDSFVNCFQRDVTQILGVERGNTIMNLICKQPMNLSHDEISKLYRSVKKEWKMRQANDVEAQQIVNDLASWLEKRLMLMNNKLTDRADYSTAVDVA